MEMSRRMEGAAKEWGMGGRAGGIGLVLSYLIVLRVSERFVGDGGRVHAKYYLRGEDMTFNIREG